MTPPDFPVFRYHPDPIATGSVVESAAQCICCGLARGYVYACSVYAIDGYERCICPWCIADGSAAAKLDATFNDDMGVGGGGWDIVPESVVAEVTCRTPSFNGWQQERWWTHCGDAAEFLGGMGRTELEAIGEDAIEGLRQSIGLPDAEWEWLFSSFDNATAPVAFLFRCRHCRKYGGYEDFD